MKSDALAVMQEVLEKLTPRTRVTLLCQCLASSLCAMVDGLAADIAPVLAAPLGGRFTYDHKSTRRDQLFDLVASNPGVRTRDAAVLVRMGIESCRSALCKLQSDGLVRSVRGSWFVSVEMRPDRATAGVTRPRSVPPKKHG